MASTIDNWPSHSSVRRYPRLGPRPSTNNSPRHFAQPSARFYWSQNVLHFRLQSPWIWVKLSCLHTNKFNSSFKLGVRRAQCVNDIKLFWVLILQYRVAGACTYLRQSISLLTWVWTYPLGVCWLLKTYLFCRGPWCRWLLLLVTYLLRFLLTLINSAVLSNTHLLSCDKRAVFCTVLCTAIPCAIVTTLVPAVRMSGLGLVLSFVRFLHIFN